MSRTRPDHIPGTRKPNTPAPPETREQRWRRLYPGRFDREERARYYVEKAKSTRSYLKVLTGSPRWPDGSYEGIACVLAGDPDSLCTTGISRRYLYTRCRRVTRPRRMPEPWRSLLVGVSMREQSAAMEHLFSDATPCPECGFTQNCASCRARIEARVQAA